MAHKGENNIDCENNSFLAASLMSNIAEVINKLDEENVNKLKRGFRERITKIILDQNNNTAAEYIIKMLT